MTNQTTQTQVLVPVDGSAEAKRAVGYAAKLAARLQARLSFAHVQPPVGSIVELKATDPEGEVMLAPIAANYPDAALTTPKIVVGTDVASAICSAFPGAIVLVGSEHAGRHLSDASASGHHVRQSRHSSIDTDTTPCDVDFAIARPDCMNTASIR